MTPRDSDAQQSLRANGLAPQLEGLGRQDLSAEQRGKRRFGPLRWDQLHEKASLAVEVLGVAIIWLLSWRVTVDTRTVSRTCLSVCLAPFGRLLWEWGFLVENLLDPPWLLQLGPRWAPTVG